MSKRILLTGGSGFIGSHTLVELINDGFECVVIDNLSNSSKDVIHNCEKIVNKSIDFYNIDLLDYEKLCFFFQNNKIDVVIHFASLKSVSESVSDPLRYYYNNVSGSINLLRAMKECNVGGLVFSSSCTVYGTPQYLPVDEMHPVGNCSNPYGWSKFMIERIIQDHFTVCDASYILLRYFNPVGAHESGLIGESPNGIPQNLFPYVGLVARERLSHVNVFGADYQTPDGTGIRDYIHVVDLAQAHVKAIRMMLSCNHPLSKVYNIGTGTGYSVLEIIKAYEKASGKKIPYVIKERRPGDVACTYNNAKLAIRELDWIPKYDLERMCQHSWNYVKDK